MIPLKGALKLLFEISVLKLVFDICSSVNTSVSTKNPSKTEDGVSKCVVYNRINIFIFRKFY